MDPHKMGEISNPHPPKFKHSPHSSNSQGEDGQEGTGERLVVVVGGSHL